MGYRGMKDMMLGIHGLVDELWTDGRQQLLAIWSRAKGKERDALLWGDEVGFLFACLRQQ